MTTDKLQDDPSQPQSQPQTRTVAQAKVLAHVSAGRLRHFTAGVLRKLPIMRSALRLPQGRVSSIKGWVNEARRKIPWDQRRTGPHYRTVRRPMRAAAAPPPRSLVDNDVPAGVWIREYEIHPELFVAVVPQARLLGPDGIVITPDHKIVEESAWTGDGWLDQDRASRAWSLPKPEFLPGHYFTIASFSAEGYAHWILDALPRLSLLRYAVPSAKIIVSGLDRSWQGDSLKHLGLDLESLVTLGERHLQLEFLHLPSYIGQPGRIHPFAVQWIRKQFLTGNEVSEPGRRLYLTRQGGRRRVVNEPELQPILSRFGFEVIDPGALSFPEQIELFSRASAIAGPHGAGLTNVVFAPRDCQIFELFARTCVRPMYYQLASLMGQPYWYLVGREATAGGQTDRGFDDLWIDPEQFELSLADMLHQRTPA